VFVEDITAVFTAVLVQMCCWKGPLCRLRYSGKHMNMWTI